MELCFMKNNALDTLKNGLPQIFDKYFTQKDNSWLTDVCGENPFEKFHDNVPDFELAPLNKKLSTGEIEFSNCKILYKHLNFLTPRQAADERLWAGLCHSVFYNYLRQRYEYDVKNFYPEAAKEIKTRFFFEATSRTGILRNTLAKCWWTGQAFFDATRNNFDKLEIIGANDISSKISYILRYPFASNPTILNGVVKFFKHFKDKKTSLGALKETLRPAIYELNKIGGAVILDCLSADEVAAIMIDHVERTLAQKNSRPIKSNPVVDTPKKFVVDVPKKSVDDTQNVKANDTITIVSLDNGNQRVYKINIRLKNDHPDIYEALIGKTINSVVTIRDEKFKITDIK